MLVALIGWKRNECGSAGRDMLFSWIPIHTGLSSAGRRGLCRTRAVWSCNPLASHAGTIHSLVALKLVIIQLLKALGIWVTSR